MDRFRGRLAFAFAAAWICVSAMGAETPVLVELFTSEGCSSCPPADRVFADLVTRQPVAGARIIGLGEHVDYWDGLGWPDVFASTAFTQRQRDYAGQLPNARVFTPQIVVDGRHSLIGSNRTDALRAIERSIKDPKVPIGLAWDPDAPNRLRVRIDAASSPATIWFAIIQSGLVTHVKRGENAGATLRHESVARELRKIGTLRSGVRFDQQVDVSWPLTTARSRSAVVFLQDPASGRILGTSMLESGS